MPAVIGSFALFHNTTGSDNTASGRGALDGNTTGNNNIAVGFNAGSNLTTGDNNIDIGNPGVAGDSGVIRIGTKGTATRALIAGINNSPIFASSVPVVVNMNGRLGFVASSGRFKRDIHDMGDASAGLLRLRPVSFRYKQDRNGTLQYGLIAEEVARVYPELVTYGADGKVETVAYHLLPAMLLNEMQKQIRENQRKDAQIVALQKQIESLQKKVEQLYWGHKWAKRHFYSLKSIGARGLRRARAIKAGALINTLGAGLGYRAMFHLDSDKLPVDVYRDQKHLPPPPQPVPFRFPYPPQNKYKQALMDRVADFVPFP